MHVLIAPEQLGSPDAYPAWCAIEWFQNYRNMTSAVEEHYHDLPEIYLWHEGRAEALIDGQPVAMRYGVMVFTAPGAMHSITPSGSHSNTGITPKAFPGCRVGHLHLQENGEPPQPKEASFFLAPENNSLAAPRELPRSCFLRYLACGRFSDKQKVFNRNFNAWMALLVREGKVVVELDGSAVHVPENHLFIAAPNSKLNVFSVGDSEIALAEGWPDGKDS